MEARGCWKSECSAARWMAEWQEFPGHRTQIIDKSDLSFI